MAPNPPAQKSNTLRNVLLGCGCFVLLAVLVGGAAFYWFVVRPTREGLAKVEELSRMEERVEDQSPYDPPADRRLTEEQVERFVAVHQAVREDLGPRWAELQARFEDTDGGAGQEPSFTEVFGFWRELGGIATDAKRRQVEALNEQGFSLAEYEWVREQAYAALGMEQLAVGIDEMVEAMKEGGGLQGVGDLEEQQRRIEEAVPPENRELVEPYREQLEEWAPLAMFGL